MPVIVREMIRLVEGDGWVCVRQTGSHRQYQHSRKSGTVTIAGKPSTELPPKTVRSILRQAQLEDQSR